MRDRICESASTACHRGGSLTHVLLRAWRHQVCKKADSSSDAAGGGGGASGSHTVPVYRFKGDGADLSDELFNVVVEPQWEGPRLKACPASPSPRLRRCPLFTVSLRLREYASAAREAHRVNCQKTHLVSSV